jgi:hypothetical protein
LFTLIAAIALAAVGVFTILGLSTNLVLSSVPAPQKQTDPGAQVSDSATGTESTELAIARALEEHYRAQYPQAFADAALRERWRAVEERYVALYPAAFAEAAAQEYWRAVGEYYRARYSQAYADAVAQARWRSLEKRYRAVYGIPAQ